MLSPPADLRDAVRHPSSGTRGALPESKRPVGCFGRSPHFGKTQCSPFVASDYKAIVSSREVNFAAWRRNSHDHYRLFSGQSQFALQAVWC
jgi:hypothetical protein